jgi:3'(2'), 5'-bisphosphate nucleotidase
VTGDHRAHDLGAPATSLMDDLTAIVSRAAAAIRRVVPEDAVRRTKADRTPVSEADEAAEAVLLDELARLLPAVPVVSEEACARGELPRLGARFFLVDPLDGTREFIKKNGEFTVNIALIEGDASVLGVVYAPALDYMVHAERGVGAFVRDGADDVAMMTTQPAPVPLRVAASRSHLDARTAAALEKRGATERIGMGSSLKFCRIAEGRMDVYPRFGPTSEWDTAAAQCVLEAAGGVVLTLDGAALRYNTKESLLNPDFIALGDARLGWKSWLDD